MLKIEVSHPSYHEDRITASCTVKKGNDTYTIDINISYAKHEYPQLPIDKAIQKLAKHIFKTAEKMGIF